MQISLAIYPDDYKTQLDIGNLFRSIKQFDSAEHHIRESLRLNPGLPMAISDLGFVYFSEQKYPEALALARTAFNKDSNNPTIMFNIGMIFAKMKQNDSAEAWLQKTLTMQPENSRASDYLTALQNELQQSIRKADSTNGN
jgi:tetratricopeptide (TPR) repeat protein